MRIKSVWQTTVVSAGKGFGRFPFLFTFFFSTIFLSCKISTRGSEVRVSAGGRGSFLSPAPPAARRLGCWRLCGQSAGELGRGGPGASGPVEPLRVPVWLWMAVRLVRCGPLSSPAAPSLPFFRVSLCRRNSRDCMTFYLWLCREDARTHSEQTPHRTSRRRRRSTGQLTISTELGGRAPWDGRRAAVLERGGVSQ